MSPETTSKPSRPSKPTTRASLRQSLNFTSVGKALADVINKEPREREEKALKKSKESSLRLSAIALMNSSAQVTVSANSRSPNSACNKEDGSPINKTITRNTRRQSSLFKATSTPDEHGTKGLDARTTSPVSRRLSTLRPRTATGTVTSALPKYRPKSAIVEPVKKPASPAHAGSRRRLSTSEEDDGDQRDPPKSKGPLRIAEPQPKRPISPLPQRALAVKVNLPSPTTPSTPSQKTKTTPSKTKSSTSPCRTGSARPAKSLKTEKGSPTRSTLTRPSSSASSCSTSQSQDSPSTPSSLKNAFGLKRSKAPSQIPTPSRSTARPPPESPLANHSRHGSSCSIITKNVPTSLPELTGHYSDDSMEAGEVDLLLAPVASLAAPTPAIPRIRCQPIDSQPQTPSRPSTVLPSRANLSYLSPIPPNSESPPALRPKGAIYDHHRGSIFSWDQLADKSQLLAHDEVESMLADVTAPFTPGGISPNVSAMGLDMPDSPSLSALPSPMGYGSISQVLLPDATPSPAVHHLTQMFETSTELPPPADSGTVALLRLQVAQVEKTACERLSLVHELEEQLHSLRQSRMKETEELAKQISFLEDQLHASVQSRERMDEERAVLTVSLQNELRRSEVYREQVAQEAFVKGQEAARASLDAMLDSLQKSWQASSAAREASFLWSSVKDQAEDDKRNLQASREVLRVFLAMLDHCQDHPPRDS
ncbi:hypothetical protein J3A83DRAFT_4401405 [Scleroderma citrinum]